MAKHRLVTIGDSMTQGFMSGAIERTDIAYPVFVAQALGARDGFRVPDFSGAGGLPLNLERLLGRLSQHVDRSIDWWELAPAALAARSLMDETEDHWERGPGSWPCADGAPSHHNLAVWGFEVRDAVTLSEAICARAMTGVRDNLVKQVPDWPMYRTARRTLNPDFSTARADATQVDVARQLGDDGGIENLIVALGANNALGTVMALEIRDSEPDDLHSLWHHRRSNLYRPEHFATLYADLAAKLRQVRAERVFLGTVPHVTIPPVTRGVGGRQGGYFEFYTRPWVWDDAFDPDRHQHLTRAEAREIDARIDAYNATIRQTAAANGWHVIDLCQLLDDLAFRRHAGRPPYAFPQGLVDAVRARPALAYLIGADGSLRLDTRFARTGDADPSRLIKGGLFSLDGVHPTTVGYGLIADAVLAAMRAAGVPDVGDLDWSAVVAADTLLHDPPRLLADLERTLGHLDRSGMLSAILKEFD